ncbi:MAG: DUF1592 domain-containing protein [Polyangiaceae bacterium]|nr:DUF1592 domain-containing protein [Polyangiaceae bacterium]
MTRLLTLAAALAVSCQPSPSERTRSGEAPYGGASSVGGANAGASVGGADASFGGGTGSGTASSGGSGSGGAPQPVVDSAELPLRRLSRVQMRNALDDAFRLAAPAQGANMVSAYDWQIGFYPADRLTNASGEKHGGYGRLDQSVQQSHVDALLELANIVSTSVTSQPAWITELVGACATDANATNDVTCLRDFVSRFGRILLRHPLGSTEVDFYTSVSDPNPNTVSAESIGKVLGLLILAPDFLYFVEHGQATALGDVIPLTAHELAARLSFHFWQSGPDAELNSLADAGTLLDDATFNAQVARLAADPKAESAVREFFGEWLRLEELENPLGQGGAVWDALRGTFTPTLDTKKNTVAEILDLVAYLYRNNAKLSDVLTSRAYVTQANDIAELYGQPAWNGQGTPPEFQDPARAGLLTRIALVASYSANTRPIMKGFRVRNALLCQTLPPPPPSAMNATVDLAPDLTTREVVERLTETPGTACLACHRQLNPLGYLTENFDPLGRTRATQKLYDSAGMLIAEKAVNTQAAPLVTPNDMAQASSAAELTAQIVASGEFERCFSQQYFRYTFGRVDKPADTPVLEGIQATAVAGSTLRELLSKVATTTNFKTRDFR